MAKQRNVYVRATPMRQQSGGASGRIKYITSPDEQEFLEAVFYSNDDPTFWIELREHCERAARDAGHDKFTDGREHVGLLDNRLAEMYNPSDLCQRISEFYKKHTGTENVVAIHWNKKHTNYHFHVIFAENKEINEVHYGAVLRQNTYYNAQQQKVNKKEAVDPTTKQLLPGYTMVPKGERKATIKRFGPKNLEFHDTFWMTWLKHEYANFHNNLINEQTFTVFKNDGLHIAQQHVGNNVQGDLKEKIELKNKLIQVYNDFVDGILELSSKLNKDFPEDHQTWVDGLKMHRNAVRKTALTKGYEEWLNAIRYCIQRFKGYLDFLSVEWDKHKDKPSKVIEMVQNEPNRRTSLTERLENIEVRKGVSVPTQQPFKAKRRYDLER